MAEGQSGKKCASINHKNILVKTCKFKMCAKHYHKNIVNKNVQTKAGKSMTESESKNMPTNNNC